MASKLQIGAKGAGSDPTLITSVSPQQAGWRHLNLEVRRLTKGAAWSGRTEGREMVIVLLGGTCSVSSNRGEWSRIGRRENVFAGMPWALYLPRNTEFTLTAVSEHVEFAACSVDTDKDHEPKLVTPADSQIEIRGGHNATRQINSILPPGFPCDKLVCVEVYTPSGNWSSYPPHKHDTHLPDQKGSVKEADLEEIYFYKFRQPDGFAFQRVYTDDRSLDEAVVAQNNDIVLVPEGYHPVATAYGYDCYYLNFLAGSAQSLAATFDPAHDWTRETWDQQDPRLPLVHHKMEEKVPV
jgi:5-deoxy-glucuronate isomerase